MTEKFLTLTLNVTYDVEDDERLQEVKDQLDDLPSFLYMVGKLSGDSDATVVTFDHQVEDNPKLVKRMLDVSMVHVPEVYRAPEVKMPYKLADHGFGFFCWVPYEDYADAPSFLVPFIELAHSKGCVYINFDNEGQVIEWLPTYDEEAKAPDAPVWIGLPR